MLELKKLSTGYDRSEVVHQVDLTVEPGQIVTILGANGAGKSTLAQTVSGLLPAWSGEIRLDGERIDRLGPRARVARRLVHVPEGRQIFTGLTVAENLRLGAHAARRDRGEAGIAKRMGDVCDIFPMLRERLAASAANLSGGQQQMLSIARGLMADPRFLVLDEPSLGLAPALVAQIFQLIVELKSRGLGVLLIEQNARMSLGVADVAHVMETGRITLSGTGAELLGRPEVVERYLGSEGPLGISDDETYRQRVARLKELLTL